MLMTVKDYAEERKISVQATYKKMHRREKELKGHVRKVKGTWRLDTYAQNVLDGIFPGETEEHNQEFLMQEYRDKIAELEKEVESIRLYAQNISGGMKKLLDENFMLKKENERLKKASTKPKFEFFSKR